MRGLKQVVFQPVVAAMLVPQPFPNGDLGIAAGIVKALKSKWLFSALVEVEFDSGIEPGVMPPTSE